MTRAAPPRDGGFPDQPLAASLRQATAGPPRPLPKAQASPFCRQRPPPAIACPSARRLACYGERSRAAFVCALRLWLAKLPAPALGSWPREADDARKQGRAADD